MEIEIKFAIEEPGYHQIVEYFESSILEIQSQWNLFFDTPNMDLKKTRRVLRLQSVKRLVLNPELARFDKHRPHSKDSKSDSAKDKGDQPADQINETAFRISDASRLIVGNYNDTQKLLPQLKTKWFLTLKMPGVFKNGIVVRPEKEVEITPTLAQELISNPSDLMSNLPHKIKKRLKDCDECKDFEIIGDFKTIKRKIIYESYTMEADETVFPNLSTIYEVQIQTDDAENTKEKIQQKFRELHVSFVNSSFTKLDHLLELKPPYRFSRVFSKSHQ